MMDREGYSRIKSSEIYADGEKEKELSRTVLGPALPQTARETSEMPSIPNTPPTFPCPAAASKIRPRVNTLKVLQILITFWASALSHILRPMIIFAASERSQSHHFLYASYAEVNAVSRWPTRTRTADPNFNEDSELAIPHDRSCSHM
jgi:hypothetical protein